MIMYTRPHSSPEFPGREATCPAVFDMGKWYDFLVIDAVQTKGPE